MRVLHSLERFGNRAQKSGASKLLRIRQYLSTPNEAKLVSSGMATYAIGSASSAAMA